MPESIFNKVTSHQHATLLEKRLRLRYFSVTFNKLLRNIFIECLEATTVEVVGYCHWIHLVYQKDHNFTNTQSRNGKRQALFCYELYKQLAASVLGGLLVLSVLHITVGHRQLPIVWEHWSAKKPRKLQK